MSVFRQPFGRGQFQLGGKSKPKKTKLPAVYDAKVDPAKVNLPALKAWGMRRLVELMGSEDEIAQALVQDVLDSPKPDPLQLEGGLAGLMDDAVRAKFVEDLWKLMVAAQEAPDGTPPELKDFKPTDAIAEDALAAAERAKAAALAAATRLQEQLRSITEGSGGGVAAVGVVHPMVGSLTEPKQRGDEGREGEESKRRGRSRSRSRSPRGRRSPPRRPHSPRDRSPTRWREHSPDRARHARRQRSPPREREHERHRHGRSERECRDEEGRRGRRERDEGRGGRHRTRSPYSPPVHAAASRSPDRLSPQPARFTPPPESLGERHSHERRPRHWGQRSRRDASMDRRSGSPLPAARPSSSS